MTAGMWVLTGLGAALWGWLIWQIFLTDGWFDRPLDRRRDWRRPW